MSIDIDAQFAQAVQDYWLTRSRQSQDQAMRGATDTCLRKFNLLEWRVLAAA